MRRAMMIAWKFKLSVTMNRKFIAKILLDRVGRGVV